MHLSRYLWKMAIYAVSLLLLVSLFGFDSKRLSSSRRVSKHLQMPPRLQFGEDDSSFRFASSNRYGHVPRESYETVRPNRNILTPSSPPPEARTSPTKQTESSTPAHTKPPRNGQVPPRLTDKPGLHRVVETKRVAAALPTHVADQTVNVSGTAAAPHSEKWIVITTIQLPTDAVRTMASQRGWSVVAVGDQKTPPDWRLENCVFLSVQRQAELGYKIHNLIPYRHYGRKNIGYLFAIQHGAKVIYDTDDDNELIVDSLEESFILDMDRTEEDMLVYKPMGELSDRGPRVPVVNPYVHFGQANMWPRGFPLSAINPSNALRYRYGKVDRSVKPYVQQGLANGDPDVDAIFRVTRKRGGAKIDMTFDRMAPPVTLPKGVMSPFNTQNTIIHQQAFWGLLVPVTTTFRVCDIWRGYWMQRVLWEVGGTLSFHTASVYQDRNEHNYFLDQVDEFPLYNDSQRLVDFLSSWQPPPGNLFSRIRDLGRKMAVHGFWKEGDVKLIDAWLTDLESVGYKPPPLVESRAKQAFGPITKFIPKSLPSTYLESPHQVAS